MVTVKIFPTLRPFLNEKFQDRNPLYVSLDHMAPDKRDIRGLAQYLGITPGSISMIIVNGVITRDKAQKLFENDRIVLSPPIAGG